jgi:uncharacterized protein (UPF0335 family)
MARHLGSKNKPKGDGGIGHNSWLRDSVDASELRSYIERVEDMNEEIHSEQVVRAEIFIELKAAGYDVATVRAIIKRRAMDADKRETADALMDQYLTALGDFAGTPLGQAGADRVREEVRG